VHRPDQRHPEGAGVLSRQPRVSVADLRRPGGDRGPEHPAVQRDKGSARTPDCHGGGAEGHRSVARRRAAGVQYHRPAGAGAGRFVRCLGVPFRWRPDPAGSPLRNHGRPVQELHDAGPLARDARDHQWARAARAALHRHRRPAARPGVGGAAAGQPVAPSDRRAADARRQGHRLPEPGLAGARARARAIEGTAADLRRSGGDRHSERAPVQRDEGSAGAPDRHRRGAANHRPLHGRRPSCVRGHRRQLYEAVSCRGRRGGLDRRRGHAASARVPRQ
jgi:hypothetical protein